MKNESLKARCAVVTGASGFIGKRLVEKLVAGGFEVKAIDRNPLANNICESILMDIAAPNALDKYVKSDTVIYHLAAKASVPASVTNPADDFRDTCYGMFEVLETARRIGCRVVFPSTASIFDIDNKLPVTERSFVRPSSPYGAAKVSAEAYCSAYNRCYGTDVRIARLFSVYGIGMSRFAIHDIVRNIQSNNRELMLLGDGNQLRDYLYIDDVVDGMEIIASKGEPGEDYNVASGEPVRILDLARDISHIMGTPKIKISVSGESFPGDVPKWYGDISKIRRIGFEPKVSLRDGLKRTVAWLSKNGVNESS